MGWLSGVFNHLPVRRYSRSVLILPPSTLPGSLGDEAMLGVIIERLRKKGYTRLAMIRTGRDNPVPPSFPIDVYFDLERYFRHETPWDLFRFLREARRYEVIIGLGADVIDGGYGKIHATRLIGLLAAVAETGVPARFTGFSFSETPSPDCVQALSRLPPHVGLCVRDTLSYARLSRLLHRPLIQVADLAFLLSAGDSEAVDQVRKWCLAAKAEGRLVMGINANAFAGEACSPAGQERLVKWMVATMTELVTCQPHLVFVMIPHDFRGAYSDLVVAEVIVKNLPEALQRRVMIVAGNFSAREAKAVCRLMDFMLTGRMHLAIACLSQAIPVAGMTYQSKFEGLFQMCGVEDMTFSPKCVAEGRSIVPQLDAWIRKREEIAAKIQGRLPEMIKLAESNFDGLGAISPP